MTSRTSYGALVIQRREAMRRARNAVFYMRAATGTSWQKWAECARERIREARTLNKLVVSRIRDMRNDYVSPVPRV